MDVGDANAQGHDLITQWGLVVEGHAAVHRALAADAESVSGLPTTWFEVLLRLRRSPESRLPMTQLAHEVSFSSGGFTKLADRLSAAGLVERVACPTDRRVTWIQLTPDGTERIDAAIAHHVEQLREHVLGVLGPDDLATLGALMRRLRDHHRAPTPD